MSAGCGSWICSLGAGPEEATELIGGMQQLLCCEETLGKLGLSSLEQRGIRGDLMGVCQYLKGARRKMRERHFTKVWGDGIRGNSLTLKESMVRLDVRKEFFLG